MPSTSVASPGRDVSNSSFGSAERVQPISSIVQDVERPFSYVNVPTSLYHNGGSSSSSISTISSFSRQAQLAATLLGSPPKQIDDHLLASGPSPISTTPPPSNFRLEPRFVASKSSPFSCNRIRGDSSLAGRGRKRTAQSMTHFNSSQRFGPTVIAGRGSGSSGVPQKLFQDVSPVVTTCGTISVGHTISTTPPSPRQVDAPSFSFQGLSLRSPNNTTAAAVPIGSNYQNTIDFGTNHVSSPAATQSSFSVCGSSSFSKVNNAFHSPAATSDGESSFRQYRSGSFGSVVDHAHPSMNVTGLVQTPLPSPRIVPLTVLTHDSVRTSQSNTTNSHRYHRQSRSFGSSVTGIRPPILHSSTIGMNPLDTSADSSSTGTCLTKSDRTKDSTIVSSRKNHTFREDHHTMMVRTPNRLLPPLPTVQYCPDSTASTTSILDSPSTATIPCNASSSIARRLHLKDSPVNISLARTPLPKISLTPRNGRSPSNTTTDFPQFPSPDIDCNYQEPIHWPKFSTTLRAHVDFVQPKDESMQTPILNVSVHTEQNDANSADSCSLDFSMDHSISAKADIPSKSNKIKPKRRESYIPFPSWGHHPPQTNDGHASTSDLPQVKTTPSKATRAGLLNATAESTPSEATVSSLRDLVVVVDEKCFHSNNNVHQTIDGNEDAESLSDDDDDVFFLAIPSKLAEENATCSDNSVRQSKQRRLHNFGTTATAPSTNLLDGHSRNRTSMTSLESTSSLLGSRFALSHTSLHGLDKSNPNLCGMTSNLSGPRGSWLNLMNSNHPSNGPHMTREGSLASIGLDLDPGAKLFTSDHYISNDQHSGRDLVTPPTMAEALIPPPLSPRFGSLKNDPENISTVEKASLPSSTNLFYGSSKRTVA